MAAAIILIPEMLSGPDRIEHPEQPVARTTNESGLKTYTIDLNNPPGASAAQVVPDERAPPPEIVPAAPQSEARSSESMAAASVPSAGETPSAVDEPNPERGSGGSPTTQAPRASSSVSSPPSETRSAPQSAPVEKPPAPKPPASKPPDAQPASAPLASSTSVPTSRGWAVQLGSFSSRETAERLADEFRSGREDVFVMPVKSGGTTLYRVRIGPVPDRATAEGTLRRVRAKIPGAAVVTHP